MQSGCKAVKDVKDSFGCKWCAVSSNFTTPDPRSKIQQSVCTGPVLYMRGQTAVHVTLLHVSVQMPESSLQDNGKMMLLRVIHSKQPFPQAAGMRYNPTQVLQLSLSRTAFVPLSMTDYTNFSFML